MKNWVVINQRRNSEWFDLAISLNRQAQKIWRSLPQPEYEDRWKFTVRLLYLRGIQSFQSAIILLRSGLVVDAGTLIRAALEDFFCIAASKDDDQLVEKLIGSDKVTRKKILGRLAKLPAGLGFTPERAAHLKAMADQIPDDGKLLNFAQIAESADLKPEYDVYYLSLSHEAAHPTIQSLEKITRTDARGEIIGFADTPDAQDIPREIATACVVGFYLVVKVKEVFALNEMESEIANLFSQYGSLIRKGWPEHAAGNV